MTRVRLPKLFAADYLDRSPIESEDQQRHFQVVAETSRTITLDATTRGLRDLLDDAEHYAEPGNISRDHIELIRSARRCLPHLRRALGSH
ncbi:hypothetical protein CKO28_00615 [Rhodovibrio sodomensis]|uniref:DUF222 domain-containing protein n=1 Tax=Rhodovibrio sodomensis TaxID=1088 RepID=A0ABS1DAB4_9PROT|nr:hypothetical protein [Rhodovibrio sodomensis]MBK1666543.1 hypothetical protein [Rhodovibrio sodomensis]